MRQPEMALRAKVTAVNRANALAAELYNQLAAVFRPLVGQQVEKQDGDLLAKAKLLPDLPCTPRTHVYRQHSNYSLAWTVKVSEPDGSHTALYYEETVYVGTLANGVLTGITAPAVSRTDYTVEEVKAKQAAHRAAQEALAMARTDLYPFDPD